MKNQRKNDGSIIDLFLILLFALSPLLMFSYFSNKIKVFLLYEIKSLNYNTFHIFSFLVFIIIIIIYASKKLKNYFGMKGIGQTARARNKQKKNKK